MANFTFTCDYKDYNSPIVLVPLNRVVPAAFTAGFIESGGHLIWK
jgi:hypothetical protein